MNAISKAALTLALVAALSACNRTEQPAGQDRRSAGHGNSQHADAGDAGHGDSHGAQPGAAGADMHGAMASAVGADVSDTWLKKMIEHHKGAIAMAEAALAAGGGDPQILAMAKHVAEVQRKEVEEMEGLVRKDAAPDPASARPYAAAEKQMHDGMSAAQGSDPGQTFVRQMIPHHEGAIAMSQVVLAEGRDERVAAIARRIVADQGKEIAELKAMVK